MRWCIAEHGRVVSGVISEVAAATEARFLRPGRICGESLCDGKEARPPRRRASVALALLLVMFVAVSAFGKKIPPAAPLDLNSATAAQLQQLPGIGSTAAQAIVRFREKSGPFRRVEDLLAIRGFSPQKLARLRPYVTVGKPGAVASSLNARMRTRGQSIWQSC